MVQFGLLILVLAAAVLVESIVVVLTGEIANLVVGQILGINTFALA